MIFTDEKSFPTTATNRRYVWRPEDTRFEAQNIQELRSGRTSLSFHGWMWAGFLGDLMKIEGHLTAQKYINILERMWPSTHANAIAAPNTIRFVHERSPIHTSLFAWEWPGKQPEMEVTDWPSKGYDMNPIENVWAMMVRTWDIGDERTPASIEIMRQQNGKL